MHFTPDPVDTISMHMGLPGTAGNEGNVPYKLSGAGSGLANPMLLNAYVDTAQTNQKGFYYGEFGCIGPDSNSYVGLTGTQIRNLFTQNLLEMKAAGVQLASMWQFNGNNNILNDTGNLGYMLGEIAYVNSQFRAGGMQSTAGVWKRR